MRVSSVLRGLLALAFLSSFSVVAETLDLNELAGNKKPESKEPRYFQAKRFRVEFTDHLRVSAGNISDSPPYLDPSVGVRVGPRSEYFPFAGSLFSERNPQSTLEKLRRFPRTGVIPVCLVGNAVKKDSDCGDLPEARPDETDKAQSKPFVLLKREDYRLYQLKSFSIDVWNEGSKRMAQFSGDHRSGISRLLSRFGLPTHGTLGIHEYIPEPTGFELSGENLEVFENLLADFGAYYSRLEQKDARFLVCAKPFKKVWEKPYWDPVRQVETYVMFPKVYCGK